MVAMSGKRIEAKDYNFSELIEKGSNIHLVPALQRPYTWDIHSVKRFVEDILDNEQGYYIGSFVMVAARGSAKRDEIIDGQQRMTTLYLILIALGRVMKKHSVENTEIVDSIFNYLVKPQHKGEGTVRLEFTNKNSNLIFNALVFGESIPEEMTFAQKIFQKNLGVIEASLEKALKAGGTYDAILEKLEALQLIYIACFDRAAAYILFESINATGVSLASTDLIKNGILQRLAADSQLLSKGEQDWKSLQEVFDEDPSMLKTFLRHEWISNGKYTSHAKIFDDFSNEFLSAEPKKVETYVKRLVKSARIYSALRNSQVESLYGTAKKDKRYNVDEVKEHLEFLNFLDVDQVYSVLLNIFTKDPDYFRRGLVRLSAFQFLFKYISGNPSTVERKFADFCGKNGDKNKLNSDLLKLCEKKKDEFVETYLDKIKYVDGRSGDIQYILERVADKLDKGGSFKKPTIEHILPKKPYERSKSLKKITDTEYKKLVNQLGNLTIVEEKDNSSKGLSNGDFLHKKKFFSKSPRKSHREILNYDFSAAPRLAVESRGKQLAGNIYDIFLSALRTGKY